jgi:NaMN:DMB phosphoribosyltransferase
MTTKELTTAQHAKHAMQIVRNTVIVRELAAELAAAEKHLQEIEERARAAGFFAGVTTYKGTTYSVATAEKTSYSLSADDADLVQFAKAHGLKTTPPRPESCSSATIRAAALKGIDVSAVADITTTEVYAVSVH